MKLSSLKIYLAKAAFKKGVPVVLLLAIFIAIFCLPRISSLAFEQIDPNKYISYFQNVHKIVSTSLKTEPETMKIYVTAYSSTPEQTDDTPCIAASGYDLCKHNKENVIACNFLPFGTKVKFPELDPDKTYTVVDRMHERYNSRMDIWMMHKEDAKKFGKKYLTVEIYK